MFGQTTCERETEILAAVRSGAVPEDVRRHMAACRRCREAVGASAWMRRMASAEGEAHALPEPGPLWWKAQLVRRWQAERRAAVPVETMQRAELWVGLLSLVSLVVWQGPQLVRWLSTSGPELGLVTVARWTTAFETSSAVPLLPGLAVLVGLAALVTATRLIVAD